MAMIAHKVLTPDDGYSISWHFQAAPITGKFTPADEGGDKGMRDKEGREPTRFKSPLRRATRKDARALSELIEYAGHGIHGYLWYQSAKEGQPPIEFGIERVLRKEADFSYRNVVVAEVDGRVAAAMLAYRLPEHSDVDLDELPDLLRPLEELELKVPGTFYIYDLAAYPEYRVLGLGTRLLEAAHTLASEAGCNELSLEVFKQNEGAVRLYERRHTRRALELAADRQGLRHPQRASSRSRGGCRSATRRTPNSYSGMDGEADSSTSGLAKAAISSMAAWASFTSPAICKKPWIMPL